MNKGERIEKLKRIGISSLWVLLVAALLVSLAFVEKEQDQRLCSAIDIRIEPEQDNFFVDRDMVIEIISNEGKETDIIQHPLGSLDVAELEQKLERNPFIYNAEVFTGIDGELKIDVYQRKPLLRVLKNDGSGYYIDNLGLKMPLSDKYSSRVLVATGNIYEKYGMGDSLNSFVTRELYTLATYIEQDAFWKAQVEQVYVDEKSELVIIPKVGDHKILFGNTNDMEDKFNRLMLFYKKGLSKTGWNTYRSINLKYKGQVICSKN